VVHGGITTTEAAEVVSRALGLRPALSARDVDTYMRGWADELPRVHGGKRRWLPEHVARLRAEVEARRSTGSAS
jgi:hypothetical protein